MRLLGATKYLKAKLSLANKFSVFRMINLFIIAPLLESFGQEMRPLSFIKVMSFQALKQLPREKIQLATKFGIAGMESSKVLVNGTPEYVRSCCEGSLKRLGVGYIDLYYQHRVDTSVPIEETVSVEPLFFPFFRMHLQVPSANSHRPASTLFHSNDGKLKLRTHTERIAL